MSDISLQAAERLRRVRDLARAIPHGNWFAGLGTEPEPDEAADAQAYVAALGLPRCHVRPVADWRQARSLTLCTDWRAEWWEAEVKLQADLTARAEKSFDPTELFGALSEVAGAATNILFGAASVAAARSGMADPAFARVAAGAAAMACHHYALCLANDDPDSAFAAKFRLFEAGHWPLTVIDNDIYLF